MADDQRHTLELLARPPDQGGAAAVDAATSPGAFVAHDVAHRVLRERHPRAVRGSSGRQSAKRPMRSTRCRGRPRCRISPGYSRKRRLSTTPFRIWARAPAPTGADAAAYAEEIGERLFELLLTDYLAAEQPGAYNVLSMLRVISIESIPATPTRPSHVRTHFRWEELPKT